MTDTKLEKLFGVEYKILKLLTETSNDSFYLREIAKELKISPMTVQRTLKKLVDTELLKVRNTKYRKYFTVNYRYLRKPLKVIINLDNPIISELLKKVRSKSKLVLL